MLDYSENNIINGIIEASESLIPLVNPWAHYDLGLTKQELDLLNNLTINASPAFLYRSSFIYYNFGNFDNLSTEIETEIKTYALNRENDLIAKNISHIITRMIENILFSSVHKEALFFIKTYKNMEFNDNEYRWHMDATITQRLTNERKAGTKCFSNNIDEISSQQPKLLGNFSITELNFFTTLYGPSTLFHSSKIKLDQARQGQGTVLISDYEYGAIHSAPSDGEARMFIAVTPSKKETIQELCIAFSC
jgi:hypothetical protein